MFDQEIGRRRTFAIISHPDAGKTTLTEKLLLFGGAIQFGRRCEGPQGLASCHLRLDGAGAAARYLRHLIGDAVPLQDCIVNLLDTPGHEDFSEDTYRTLTAVDSALMVIDCAKGVEERTIKLMEVCRLRDTPIMTFINKLDRDGREPMSLLDEVESVLKIRCAPITWPLGMGRELRGIYHLTEDRIYIYAGEKSGRLGETRVIEGLQSKEAGELLGADAVAFRAEAELVRGASHAFDVQEYLAGRLTPVFFGSAVNNFGVRELLDAFVEYAPAPRPRAATHAGAATGEETHRLRVQDPGQHGPAAP